MPQGDSTATNWSDRILNILVGWVDRALQRDSDARMCFAQYALAALVQSLLFVFYFGNLVDDAYITLVYARNYYERGVWCFNQGEVVEGLTNIGWAWLQSRFGALNEWESVSQVLGAVFGLGTVALVIYLIRSRRLAPPTVLPGSDRRFSTVLGPFIAVLIIYSCFSFSYFAVGGMETAAASLVLMAMVSLIGIRHTMSQVLCGFIGSIAVTLRPETMLVVPVFVLLSLIGGARRTKARSLAGLMLGFACGCAVLAAFRWEAFGSVLPNTFYAKPFSLAALMGNAYHFGLGDSTNLPFYLNGLAGVAILSWLAIMARNWFVSPAGRMAISVLATGLIFALYASPDWTGQERYFAPFVPAFAVVMVELSQATLSHLQAKVAGKRTHAFFVLGLLAAVTFVFCVGLAETANAYVKRREYPGFVLYGQALRPAAEWIRENTAVDCVIATRRIGVLGFVGRREIFDYKFALIHRDLARRIREQDGRRAERPDAEFLKEEWLARSPDYILEDDSVLRPMMKPGCSAIVVHGAHYLHETSFRVGKGVDWMLFRRVDDAVASVSPECWAAERVLDVH